jgi:hypothetical protein
VDALPTDLSMQALVEADRSLSKQHQCHVCENVVATATCLDCGDFLCENCTNVHNKLTSSKHHTVKKLAGLTSDKLLAKQGEQTCPVHGDRKSEVFCPGHGAAFCLLCATTDHRECKGVMSLFNKIVKAQQALQGLAKNVTGQVAGIERDLSSLDKQLDQAEKQVQVAVANMDETFYQLESALKDCHLRLKVSALGEQTKFRQNCDSKKAALLTLKGKLSEHKRAIERAQGIPSPSTTQMAVALQARMEALKGSKVPIQMKNLELVVIDTDVAAYVDELLKSDLTEFVKLPASALVKVTLPESRNFAPGHLAPDTLPRGYMAAGNLGVKRERTTRFPSPTPIPKSLKCFSRRDGRGGDVRRGDMSMGE